MSTWLPPQCAVKNRVSGATYSLQRADLVTVSESQITNLTEICNQQAIYDFLFRTRLQGIPYSAADAVGFFTWAVRGWQDQTHFVFLLTDHAGLVVGAVDIKSPNHAEAEIGYTLANNSNNLN